jgi:hypothetical protein
MTSNVETSPRETSPLEKWMAAYQRAWRSNSPGDIRAVFAADAAYRPDPWTEAWRGHEAIVLNWLARLDEDGDWTFEWSELVSAGDLFTVTGETRYEDGTVYSNLWVIRLDAEGRATEFTEWWMDHERTS